MTEQDWIILRLLMAATPKFGGLTNIGKRDFTKSIVYLNSKYGLDVILDSVDQLREEA